LTTQPGSDGPYRHVIPHPDVTGTELSAPMPCFHDRAPSLDDALFTIFEDSIHSANHYQSSMAAAVDPFRNDWSLWS
jgi:hypothetical protein